MFELIDKETNDNSVRKRDSNKVCHQQGAKLNNRNQKIDFLLGDNNNYHQIGNSSYLQYDITFRKRDNTSFKDGAVRL